MHASTSASGITLSPIIHSQYRAHHTMYGTSVNCSKGHSPGDYLARLPNWASLLGTELGMREGRRKAWAMQARDARGAHTDAAGQE
jgi:hypothetical protein